MLGCPLSLWGKIYAVVYIFLPLRWFFAEVVVLIRRRRLLTCTLGGKLNAVVHIFGSAKQAGRVAIRERAYASLKRLIKYTTRTYDFSTQPKVQAFDYKGAATFVKSPLRRIKSALLDQE